MPDLSQAYAILGLTEQATEQEVEQRYELLVRKNRGRSAEADRESGEPGMTQITAAYKAIKSTAMEELIKEKEPRSKAVQRIGHIWEYYRWHIIGIIAAVLIIVSTVNSILDNRSEDKRIARADVKITFFTDYQIQNADTLKLRLLEDHKDWKDIHMVYQYAPIDPKDEYGAAMLQKAVITMTADKTDVYIMDRANFDKFGKQGAFLNLNGAPALAPVPQDKKLSLQVQNDGQLWLGIDVSGNAALKALDLPAGEKIAAVRVNSNKLEQAFQTLAWLAKP